MPTHDRLLRSEMNMQCFLMIMLFQIYAFCEFYESNVSVIR